MKQLVFILIFVGITGTFSRSAAQTMSPEKNSIVTKSVRPVGEFPVVYQHEINGGIHQYAGTPWSGDDAVEVTLERIRLGMLATNTNDNSTYRYIGTVFTDDVATSNAAADWERILLITAHNPGGIYKTGEIVIDNGIMYQALSDVDGSSTPVAITNAAWNPLSETVTMDDRASASNTVINSRGETIILANANVTDIPLASDATAIGKTYTIKNVKTTTATSEINLYNITIDGIAYTAASPLSLWRKNDYITILSDGTNWYKIAEGATNVAQPTADITDANDHDDAFYWGNPDDDNSWRIIYDSTNEVLVIQRREGGSWVNKTSIIP